MNRHVVGLIAAATVASVTSVAVALPSPGAKMTAKQAALRGVAAPKRRTPRQVAIADDRKAAQPVSRKTSLNRCPRHACKRFHRPLAMAMKSVRVMAGGTSLLALDTPVSLSEAKAVRLGFRSTRR